MDNTRFNDFAASPAEWAITGCTPHLITSFCLLDEFAAVGAGFGALADFIRGGLVFLSAGMFGILVGSFDHETIRASPIETQAAFPRC